jgi:hypothetical protein
MCDNITEFEVAFNVYVFVKSFILNNNFVLSAKCDGESYLERIKKKNFHSLAFLNIPRYYDLLKI